MMQSAEPPITVVHYEYLDWPDTSTPSSTRAVRELVRALYSIPPQAGPFVVHCSAGIGRTGTFCTIDHTLRRILAGDLTAINIENTVQQFRQQRDGMVQTLVFIYLFILLLIQYHILRTFSLSCP
jgi:protein tyrosine phosphatase